MLARWAEAKPAWGGAEGKRARAGLKRTRPGRVPLAELEASRAAAATMLHLTTLFPVHLSGVTCVLLPLTTPRYLHKLFNLFLFLCMYCLFNTMVLYSAGFVPRGSAPWTPGAPTVLCNLWW